MNRGRRVGNLMRRQRTHQANAEQAIVEYRQAAFALQNSAYRNLRQVAANVPILLGVISAGMLALGDVTLATLAPLVLILVGGILAVAYYFAQNRPGGWRLLPAAWLSTAIGLAAFVLARKAIGQ